MPHLRHWRIKRSRDELSCFFINLRYYSTVGIFKGIQRYMDNYLTAQHYFIIEEYYIKRATLWDIVNMIGQHEYFTHQLARSALVTISHVTADAVTLAEWFNAKNLEQYFCTYPPNYLPDDE